MKRRILAIIAAAAILLTIAGPVAAGARWQPDGARWGVHADGARWG